MGPYDPRFGVQGLGAAPGHIGNHMTRSSGFGCCAPVVPNLADLAKFVPEFSGLLPRKWDLGPKRAQKEGGSRDFDPQLKLYINKARLSVFGVHNNRMMKNLRSSSLFNGGKPLRKRASEAISRRCNPSF